MAAINKLGTQIQFDDGRVATVVFNGLCGVGVKWGLHDPNPRHFEDTHGDVIETDEATLERMRRWLPDALLRSHPDGEIDGVPCIPDDYTITRVGLT